MPGPLHDKLSTCLREVLGHTPVSFERLHGGCIAQVYLARFAAREPVVIKLLESSTRQNEASLETEGFMLEHLRSQSSLPVPQVLHAEPTLLLLNYVSGASRFSPRAQEHAAELLAQLHAITAPHFGFERDTLIGPLSQPNPWTPSWVKFFRDHRLLHMASLAAERGQLDHATHERLRRLASDLSLLLEEPLRPALLHGDVWTTNVLAEGDAITGFLDPAISFGHPEIELAFITLFSTFGERFFNRYAELRPIRPGFFETRRDIYNLYPLLVHVALFGAAYASQIRGTLRRLGY